MHWVTTQRLLSMSENKMVSHVFPNFGHMAEVLLHRSVVVAILTPVIGSLKVVVARGAITISVCFATMVNHFLHPSFFSIMCAVKAMYAVLSDKVNAVSYVLTLAIQNICQIEREESLISAHDK